MAVREARAQDATAIADIYNPFIEHTHITFEVTPITADDVRARMQAVAGLQLPWLVWDEPLENGPRVLAYAYAGKFRERSAYRFTVETAIYVSPESAGKGIGRALYSALLAELKKNRELHRAVGGIALPNQASIKLHEQLGFQWVGTFSEVGRKFDRWIDVGFWQLNLDRSTDSMDAPGVVPAGSSIPSDAPA